MRSFDFDSYDKAALLDRLPKQERLTFINAIISVYKSYMGLHKTEVKERASLAVLQHWAENAELCIIAGNFQDAFNCLYELTNEFEASGGPGEFARVGELLFSQVDWSKHGSYPHFDSVVRTHVRILANLGREGEYRRRLDQFAEITRQRDARYVGYCDLQCFVNWVIGDYATAIEWGERGQKLKGKAGADNCPALSGSNLERYCIAWIYGRESDFAPV
jgi:hypothetical protein